VSRRYQDDTFSLDQAAHLRSETQYLLSRLRRVGDTSWPQPGYVIDSDETDEHVTHDYAFCWEHARMVALGDSILTGFEMFPVNTSQDEADFQEYCAFHGCSEPLNTGTPTDRWIDNALGLTEADPYAVVVTPYELTRSAANMRIDDRRWPVWMRQAKRVLTAARGGAR